MTKILKALLILLIFTCLCSCSKEKELKIHIISDVHYAPRNRFEYSGNFKISSDTNGTGKQIQYQEEIIDAYINEELENNPDYIFVTGDMVFSGSKENHIAFADKFKRLIDNGVKVLLIPGNHDFDSTPINGISDSAIIYGSSITKDDFLNIYSSFGYSDADSIDDNSLSYSYKLDNTTYLIALDTISNYGKTDGSIKEKTLAWIEERLNYAKNKNLDVIIIGHHNLYLHNEMFEYGYTLNNSQKLINLMKKYNVKLYISGHMHIQDICSNSSITEVLNQSFTLYPHRYGELIITNHKYQYLAKSTNVEKYGDQSIEDIKNYNSVGYNFLYNNFYSQRLNSIKKDKIDDDTLNLVDLETIINMNYFMGIKDNTDYSNLLESDQVSIYIKLLLKHLDDNNLSINGSLN